MAPLFSTRLDSPPVERTFFLGPPACKPLTTGIVSANFPPYDTLKALEVVTPVYAAVCIYGDNVFSIDRINRTLILFLFPRLLKTPPTTPDEDLSITTHKEAPACKDRHTSSEHMSIVACASSSNFRDMQSLYKGYPGSSKV